MQDTISRIDQRFLNNLVKINQLKAELPDQNEFDGMLSSAKRRLKDAKTTGLSEDSVFSLAYWAAHALLISSNALAWVSFK